MSDWGDLEALPERRKRSPWFWFCGSGCLLFLIATFAGGMWLKDWWADAQDPEVQWSRLDRVLDFDERPEGWEMQNTIPPMFGLQFFHLASFDEDGRRVAAVHVIVIPADDIDGMFDTSDSDLSLWTPPGASEPVETILIQGEERSVVRSAGDGDIEFGGGSSKGSMSFPFDEPAIVVDVTPAGAADPVTLFWTSNALDEVTVADIQRFLDHFEVVPGHRETPASGEPAPGPGAEQPAGDDGE